MLKDQEVNFHTHTPLCHHATGLPWEYCKAALDAGIKVLGFSEHGPFPDGHFNKDHMIEEEIPQYLSMLDQARETVPGITVLQGIEADWIPDMGSYRKYRDLMQLDYILGSAHWIKYKGKDLFFIGKENFDEEVFAAFLDADMEMLKSGVVDIIAHPDAAAGCYKGPCTPLIRKKFRELAAESRRRNVPLEINQNGLRGEPTESVDGPRWRYPWEPLWQIAAEEDSPVVIGIDAHHPERFSSENRRKLQDFAGRLGLRIVNAEFAEKFIERSRQHG